MGGVIHHLVISLGLYWGSIGIILELHWGYLGIILGLYSLFAAICTKVLSCQADVVLVVS